MRFIAGISILPNAVIFLNETVMTKNQQKWTSGNVAFAGFNFIVLFPETDMHAGYAGSRGFRAKGAEAFLVYH